MATKRRYIKTQGGYGLTANGELWRLGRHGYMAGYVSDPENMDIAIEAAEEESRCLMAEAAEEFGW